MIRSRRSVLLAAGILGLSLLSCGREVTGPENGLAFGRDRFASLALAPQFPRIPGANAISDLVPFERVRITLRRADGTIAKDTLVAFPSTADSIRLAIDVPLPITAPDSGITLGLSLAYVNAAGDTVFRGGPLPITARRSNGTSQPISIPVSWVPPGGVVPASVELTPATGTAVAGTTTTFTAVARDGQGQPIAGTPIFFSSEDTLRARVANVGSGVVTWLPVRGTTRIIATLPNGPADTSSFDVSLPASRLLLVAGDGQSATINTALAQPLSFRVTASDSVPVAGMPVTFTVTTGGGTLGALADTSDANGLVSTSWTLGALVGAQSVTATVTGVPAATRVLTATGIAPAPTQLAITAAPAAAVAGATFPPVTVEARDAGGALASLFTGAVSLALDPATAGGATLGGTLTVNAVAGVATFADLSITRVSTGLALVATSAGLAPDTSAALTITTGAASALTLVSGDGQAGVISAGLPLPFIVRVTDAFANPVPGVTVNWAITSGGGALSAPSAVTDAFGNASVSLTTGASAGASTVTATVAGLTGSPVTFTTTVTAGAPASLTITSGPIGPQVAGVPLAPLVLEARDAGGNLVPSFTGQVIARAELGGVAVDSAEVTAVAGIATFVGESFVTAGTYLIRFSAAGLSDAVSDSFVVAPAAAATMTLIGGNAQSGAVSTALADSVAFRVTDAFGNPVPNVGWTIAVTGGGGSVSPAGGNADAAGEFRTRWTLGAAVGAQSISAFVTAQPAILAAATATATAGTATQLVITSAPFVTRIAGDGTYDLVLEARDAGGNLVTTFTGDVVGRIDTGPFVGTDSSVVAAVGGIATFSTQPIELAGTYTLRFTAAGLADAVTPPFDVIAAAPATIVGVEGGDETAPVLTTLPDSLGARVDDAFGNPIAGVTVTWTVTSGGGSIAPATSVTGADGVARAAWTLGGTVGTQNAQAEAAGFSTGFTAAATASGADVVWTGAVSSDPLDVANWSGGALPTTTESVLVPAGRPNYPVLPSNIIIGGLIVEDGATVNVGSFALFVNGSVRAPQTPAFVTADTGGVVLQGAAGAVEGRFPKLYLLAGDYTVSGAITVDSSLIMANASDLFVGPNAVTVGARLITTGGGTLSMTVVGGSVVVSGDALFNGGSTAGRLTAGTLTVRGDFTQAGGAPDAFSAGIGHTVVLDGPATQSVTLLNPDATFTPTCAASCFGTLRSLRNAGTGTLQIGSDLKALATIDVSGEGLVASGFTLVSAGTPSLAADVVTAARVGWQDALVRTAGSFLVDTLVAWGTGTLIVGEVVPTVVLGTYAVAGTHTAGISVEGDGVLAVGGTALVGSGTGTALRTRGNGRVLMQEAADSLALNGSADFGGTTIAGTMNAGVLGVTGDLTQSGAGRTLFAEGGHLTRLLGANSALTFADTAQNQLASLALDGAGAVTVAAGARLVGNVAVGPTVSVVGGAGRARIGGGLVETIGNRWQMPTTQFDGVDPTLPPAILGDVVFMQGVVLDGPFTGSSVVTVAGGALDVGGQRLEVAGELATVGTGTLRMTSPADTVVTFNASFAGGNSEGQLTAGRLDILGSFSQTVTGGAFRAGPGHETWFLGNLSANVDFAAPGFGADSSHFGTLYLSQPLGAQVSVLTDVYVNGLFENGGIATASQVTGSGQRIVSRGAEFSNLQFNNVRWQLVDGAAVDLIDSLTFAAMDPGAIAFEVIRSGGTIAIPNLAFSGAVPTTGRYLRVEDSDGAAGGTLTIDLTNVSPATNGGFLETVNGAVVNGWTAGAFVWTGATSTDWFDPANWVQNAVPGASDSVHVPAAGVSNPPTISVGTAVRALVNDNASPITFSDPGLFTITERAAFRSDVVGLVCPAGTLGMGAAGAATLRGRVACSMSSSAASITFDGPTTIEGESNVSMTDTDLIVNGQKFTVVGALQLLGASQLVMTGAADSVDLGYALFQGDPSTGSLTAGDLVIRGHLTTGATADAFDATGTHRTRFLAGTVDTASVSAFGGGVHFAQLEIARPVRFGGGPSRIRGNLLVTYGGAIIGAGPVAVDGDFTGTTSTLVAPSVFEIAGVLADTGTFRPDTTIFTGTGQVMPFRVGATAIPDYQVVRIVGDVTMGSTGGLDSVGTDLLIDGGTFRVDAATMAFLRVGRDLSVTNGGRLFSQNANHQYLIYRHVLFDGADGTGTLAAGSFRLRGDFTQLATSSALSFAPAPAFAVVLDSVGTISFATPTQSRFGRLGLAALGPVRTLLSDVEVTSTLEVNGAGSTLRSDVLGAGGTRRITANGAQAAEATQFQNVALRLQGHDVVDLSSPLTFSDFDPLAIQFEIARDSGTIELYDPTFATAPSPGGLYLRIEDTAPADGLDVTVNINGTVTPAFHGGYSNAIAPAIRNGWNDAPSFTWTGGATNSDWNNTLNWSGGAVPTATDSVYVPGALLYNPVIPNGTVLRSFVSARTESAISAAGTVAITGHLSVPIVGGLTCAGALSFANPSVTMSARGRVACFTRLLDGTLTVSDSLGLIGSDLQVEGTAILDATGGVLVVDGPFSTLGGGRLRMQSDSSHVALNSGASFGGGSTAGLLTAGLLEIGGNFTQNGDAESFSASGTHLTELRGGVTQQVVFAAPGANAGTSHFANLAVGQTEAGVSVQLNSDAFAIGQLRTGTGATRQFTSSITATLTTHGADITSVFFDNVRWQIRGGAPLAFLDGVAFYNMPTDVTQLDVERTGPDSLFMSNVTFGTVPTTGAYVRVADLDGATNGPFVVSLANVTPGEHGGAVIVNAPAELLGWLATAPFIWTGAEDTNWEETNNWLGGVVPGASDSVTIDAGAVNGPDISAPTTLRALVNESATVAVTLQSQPLTITERLVTQYDNPGIACADSPLLTIAPTGAATVAGHVACDMLIAGTGITTLSDSLLLGRSLVMGGSGQLDVNGQVVRVLDSLATAASGRLRMTSPGSLVEVQGDANFAGGSTQGLLTAGLLLLRGDFRQSGDPESFAASGTHETEFSTEGTQSISMTDASPTIGGASHFNHLRIAQAPDARIDLLSRTVAIGQLRESMPGTAVVRSTSEQFLEVGGTAISGVRFDNVLFVIRDGATIDLLQGLTFDSTSASATPFRILRTGGSSTLDGVTFGVVPNFAPGVYLIVADQAQVDGDSLTLTVVNPSPASHSNLVATFGGRLFGWPAAAAGSWTGAVDTDWSNPGNWSGGTVPDLSTDVTIPVTGNSPVISDRRAVRDLTIENGATLTLSDSDTLTVTGNTVVTGTIAIATSNEPSTVLRLAPASSATLAAPGTIAPRLLIESGTVTLSDSVRVTGNVTMGVDISGGTLDLNQHRMNVTGSFRTSGFGTIRMQAAADSLLVDGNLLFDGGDTEGLLTDGTIVAGGDFWQQSSSSANAFVATGGHTVRFAGSTSDSDVRFATAGPTSSRLGNVALDKSPPRVTLFNNTPIEIASIVSNEGPVVLSTASVTVSGTVVQPGPSGTWDVGLGAAVVLSGVNPATCDGITFVVTGTQSNFAPPSCYVASALLNQWDAGGNGSSWSDPLNWSLDRVPALGDSVVIASSPPSLTIDAATAMSWLIVTPSSSPIITIANGGVLDVDVAAVFSETSTLNIATGGTLTGAGSVSVLGVLNWDGGTMSGAGGTLIAGSSTASVATSGTVSIADRVLAVAGTMNVGAGAIAVSGDPAISVSVGGTLNLTATNTFLAGSGTMDLVNSGTIRKSASAGVVRIDWPIANISTIEVEDETLDLRNTFDHVLGSVVVQNGATLLLGGETQAAGGFTIADGGVVELRAGGVDANAGNHHFAATSSIIGAGWLRVNAADTVQFEGTIDIDSLTATNALVEFNAVDTVNVASGGYLGGGFFRGSSTIAVSGVFTVAAGNPNGTGTFFVRPGGVLQTTAAAFRGWDIDVAGTWNWGDGDLTLTNDPLNVGDFSVVTIRPGGLLSMNHGATARSLFGYAGVGIVNNGTLRKASGTATTTTFGGLQIANVGTIDVLSGGFTVQTPCTVAGAITGGGTFTGTGCGP